MSIFRLGDFRLHSGARSGFKIDCDALNFEDWEALAVIGSLLVPSFGSVEGVPEVGILFAKAIRSRATQGPLLIVDDVYTTGNSMEQHRAGRDAIGLVVFARNQITQPWITSIFQMNRHLV